MILRPLVGLFYIISCKQYYFATCSWLWRRALTMRAWPEKIASIISWLGCCGKRWKHVRHPGGSGGESPAHLDGQVLSMSWKIRSDAIVHRQKAARWVLTETVPNKIGQLDHYPPQGMNNLLHWPALKALSSHMSPVHGKLATALHVVALCHDHGTRQKTWQNEKMSKVLYWPENV